MSPPDASRAGRAWSAGGADVVLDGTLIPIDQVAERMSGSGASWTNCRPQAWLRSPTRGTRAARTRRSPAGGRASRPWRSTQHNHDEKGSVNVASLTRQIICCAGKVLQTPRGAVYSVSQRAEHIWEGVSSATARSHVRDLGNRRPGMRSVTPLACGFFVKTYMFCTIL